MRQGWVGAETLALSVCGGVREPSRCAAHPLAEFAGSGSYLSIVRQLCSLCVWRWSGRGARAHVVCLVLVSSRVAESVRGPCVVRGPAASQARGRRRAHCTRDCEPVRAVAPCARRVTGVSLWTVREISDVMCRRKLRLSVLCGEKIFFPRARVAMSGKSRGAPLLRVAPQHAPELVQNTSSPVAVAVPVTLAIHTHGSLSSSRVGVMRRRHPGLNGSSLAACLQMEQRG